MSVREEKNSFVLWVVGIAGRDAYVRDFVVCVWSLSIVRMTNKVCITFFHIRKLPRKHQLY